MPNSALIMFSNFLAILRVICFSNVPDGPTEPGSCPPWPASIATMMSRSRALVESSITTVPTDVDADNVGDGFGALSGKSTTSLCP